MHEFGIEEIKKIGLIEQSILMQSNSSLGNHDHARAVARQVNQFRVRFLELNMNIMQIGSAIASASQ